MPPRPFPTRLVVAFALAMAGIVGGSGATVFYAGRVAAHEAQVRRPGAPHVAAAPVGAAAGGPPSAEDRARLADAAAILGRRITLVAGDGRVLFDTHEPAEGMLNHNDRPEVVAARRGAVGSDRRRSATIDRHSLYVARLLDQADPGGVVVRVSDPSYAAPALTGAPGPRWPARGGGGAGRRDAVAAAAAAVGRALRHARRHRRPHGRRAVAPPPTSTAPSTCGLFASRLNGLAARASGRPRRSPASRRTSAPRRRGCPTRSSSSTPRAA